MTRPSLAAAAVLAAGVLAVACAGPRVVTPAFDVVSTGMPRGSFRIERRDDVTVRVTARPANVQVWLDGHEAGLAPIDLHLGPGRHRIELRLPGY